jgi:hypothetical protein
MAKDTHRMGNGILGDIDPAPEPESPHSGEPVRDRGQRERNREESSRDERSRNESEGATGGVGPETGGSRNYHSNAGATGGDVGNRPE